MILLLCWLGCAPWVASSVRDVSAVQQFGLSARGHAFAGLGAVRMGDAGFSLEALSPAGVTLFTVAREGEGATAVHAPDPAMAAMLEKLPFERDLSLALRWSCPGDGPRRCAVPGGALRVGDHGVRYAGVGGPARITQEGPLTRIVDPLRGYSLVLRAVAP